VSATPPTRSHVVLWIVGEPGVGKTTLARQFVEPDSYLVPRPKLTVGARVVAAGHYVGGSFDGADNVPIGQIPELLPFWEREGFRDSHRVTLFDGDKFSSQASIKFFTQRWVHLVHLVCALLIGPELAAERRRARGSSQAESWIAGRRTKSRRFAQAFPGTRLDLSAELSPVRQAEEISVVVEKLTSP
jgi:hypothetical protein